MLRFDKILGYFLFIDIWYIDVVILYWFYDKFRCGFIVFVVRLKWDLICFIMFIYWNVFKEKMEIFDIMFRYILIYMYMENLNIWVCC